MCRRVWATAWSAMCVVAASCGGGTPGTSPDAPGEVDAGIVDAPPDGPPVMANCMGLPATCGAAGNEDCCQKGPIPGGTFHRSYDGAGFPDMGFPATISDFVLDKYEVTVGRFRGFLEAGFGTQTNPPAAGAGARAGLPGSGWDSAWNARLLGTTLALRTAIKCNAAYETWTDAPGANESKPLNCVTWYEAMAFCIWDGGYLATEAEWNYAASGGSEQRVYPWSSPASSTMIDCTHANYYVDNPAGTFCVDGMRGGTNRVGTEAAKGNGRWGHADLAGNLYEWTLDWHAPAYSPMCNDCANLTPGTFRVVRGGSFLDSAAFLRGSARGNLSPADRADVVGFRCARKP